eukprot:m.104283 g.104283  ORF g.104283 m.104283 type:complete len:113 (+) comp37202_c0_seq5:629-967(+)
MKSKSSHVKVVLADPQGSVLYNWFHTGEMKRTDGSSITEGIGQGRLTENLKGTQLDDALLVKDSDAVEMTFRLLYEEGFCVGASSGLNVSAAVQVSSVSGNLWGKRQKRHTA